MEDNKKHIDHQLKNALEHFEPDTPSGMWDNIVNKLDTNNPNNTFIDGLANYKPAVPNSAWGNIESQLGVKKETFIQNLKNLAPIVPLNAWQGIRQKLDKKKRRFIIWWWFSSVASLIIIGASLFTLFNSSNFSFSDIYKSEKEQTMTIFDNKKKINKTIEKNLNRILDKEDVINDSPKINTNKQLNSADNIIEKANKNQKTKEVLTKSNNSENRNEYNHQISKIKENNSNNSTPFKSHIVIGEISTLDSKKIPNPLFKNFSKTPTIPYLNITKPKLLVMKHKVKNSLNWKNGWVIGAHINTSAIAKTLGIKKEFADYVHKDYLKIRNNQEKTLPSLIYGVQLKKYWNNFSISTGINLIRMQEAINYNYTVNEIPTEDATLKKDINGYYPIVFYIPRPQAEKVVLSRTNTLEFIEIPLTFGYKFNSLNKKYFIEPYTGINYMHLLNVSGFNPNYHNTELQALNTNNLSTGNLSISTGFNAGINLGKNFEFTFGPRFFRLINNINSKYSSNTQKTQSYGLNLGINYRLDNNKTKKQIKSPTLTPHIK